MNTPRLFSTAHLRPIQVTEAASEIFIEEALATDLLPTEKAAGRCLSKGKGTLGLTQMKPDFSLQNVRNDFSLQLAPHELIEKRAEEAPESPAILMGTRRLSYREVNEQSNRLAHFLRAQGAGPGQIIGVLLDRSIEMVVCLLGILKAGAVYLPLDPKFPKDRLAFMLDDAEVMIVLTQADLREDAPSSQARIVVLEELAEALPKFSSVNLSVANSPDDTAYVIYTSGSTGNPKGVMVPRRALTNFLLSMAEQPGMTASDVLLAITTISFDISFLEMLLPLSVGAQIVIAGRSQVSDPFELRKLLDQHGITVMQATPTTWRLLLESKWEGKTDLKILCGGEALTQDLAERLLSRCSALWNMYGPTETTVWSSTEKVTSPQNITLGSPIANTELYVVDEQMQPVAPGASGELLIGGSGLALGYLKREELTAQKFIPDSIGDVEGAKLYRTGDEVRYRTDGTLEFLGRLDHQVKLNGFRIELGEIENALATIEGVRQAVVILREDVPGDKRLVAYYTGKEDLDANEVLHALRAGLPDYMVPSAFVWMAEFPQTPNAKLDRKALPAPARKRPLLGQQYIAPATEAEKQMAMLWQELLRVDQIGVDDSFFDLGGNSIAVFRMVNAFHHKYGREIPPVKVFQYPTIGQLCRFSETDESQFSFVAEAEKRIAHTRRGGAGNESSKDAVAIVGMVGRFPGAENLDQLWKNLRESKESISFFTPEELGPGIEERLRNAPDYIRARGMIEGAELFDPGFFGVSPLEAKVMDPQQRIFLELAYNALENAGYDPSRYKGLIGVYAGAGDNHYYTTNLLTHPDLLTLAGKLAVEYGNEKDYIALRTAYLLDLRGPAVSLNTACSTTLLAVDLAYRALRDYECDIALAGGVDIAVPQKSGFHYTEGGTFARDGHCRPFDADATGTMFCDGAGIVVLKRLSDALKDGDTIYAVLRGCGKNNNGARPASFLAPSVEGQAEAIAMAQASADVDVETIGYIEAHGTGTPVGDPIEVQALNTVFERKTKKKQFCYIGSIKGNIGHPTNAAGVAGLIKAAMVLDREEIPATLHFKTPNPRIDFVNSPFVVADRLIPFTRNETPRHTAVSSFGFGGTNVHVVLEEAPARRASGSSRPMQLLPFSGRAQGVLDAYCESFSRYFESSRDEDFADAGFTLQTGRKQMAMRRIVVAGNPAEAARLLQHPDPRRCSTKRCERRDPPVVFLFGGQGTQYVNMGKNLYDGEPLFRAAVDNCCEILKPHLGRDLRELLYPNAEDSEAAQASLQDTFFTQPSLFVIEYALARFWESLGIRPAMMAGHSIGEFVAATLADVWDLEDALRIVALRGRLMQSLPRGSMMAVRAAVDAVRQMLPPGVQIAANNSPSLCVVSGPDGDVTAFREQLEAKEIICRPLHTSHAFHSFMMDPMLEPLKKEIAKVQLRAPSRPFVSTVTGQLITEAETTSPEYWAHQARATVEFSKAALKLKELGHDLFLECGPRSTMCSLVRQHFAPGQACTAIPTLADSPDDNQEWASMLFALGSLWLNGATVDWDAFYANEDRRHIPLPTYPFERRKYWVDPAQTTAIEVAPRGVDAIVVLDSPEPQTDELIDKQMTGLGAQTSRKQRIIKKLVDLLMPLTGREREELSPSAMFLEQGLDSLSLAQVSVAIEQEFGVKVGFSKLMNQFPTAEMVAGYLDETMPAELLAQAPQRLAQPVEIKRTIAPAAHRPDAGLVDSSLSAIAQTVAEQGRILAAIQETLAKMSAQQLGLGIAAPTVIANPAPAVSITSAPTTTPQRGIFYSSRLSENLSGSYNESVTLFVMDNVAIPQIKRALERLVERHDALRASFNDSGSVMRIGQPSNLDIPVKDLSRFEIESERQEALSKLAYEEAARPFVLPDGPLFRFQIVLLEKDKTAVIVTVHHIICDGWSVDVLIQDFSAFYSEELTGQPASLRPPSSFAGYANDVARRELSPEFEAAREYWGKKFSAGFPALVLPADLPREAVREHRAIRVDRTIGAEIVGPLRNLAAEQGCSIFAVTVAALSILLARISGQGRFVLPLSTAEQPFLGKTNLVGHCVSLMPYLVELRPDEDVISLVRRVQSELAEAIDHLSFTTVNLLEDLASSSRARLSPVPVGLTGIKKIKPEEMELRGFSLDYVANPKSFESFEWYLSAMETNQELEVHGHYDIGLFKQETIVRWLTELETILTEMGSSPKKSALELARLADEKAQSCGMLFTYSPQVREVALPGSQATPLIFDEVATSISSSTIDKKRNRDILGALTKLFQRALGSRVVGVDDNFFDLGGHSMKAARLFALIERELKITAPLAALYEAPTPRTLANMLASGISQERWQALVPIHEGGDRIPLFLVHGAEGNVLLYRGLSKHLGQDQPVYGLQSVGLDGKTPVDGNFERVARRYVEEIRAVQTEGPYMLGGYCLGGVIAMEMARQLIQDGQTVGLLAMIENFNIRSVHWPLPWHVRMINRFALNPYHHLRNVFVAEGAGKMDFFRQKLDVEIARAKLEVRLAWAHLRGAMNLKGEAVEEYHHVKIADVYDKALAEHEIVPYPGVITIFKTEYSLMGMDMPLDGWARVARDGVREIKLPFGPKASLTEPFVQLVAVQLRKCMDEASQEWYARHDESSYHVETRANR